MNPYWGANYWGQPQGGYYHPHVYYPPGYNPAVPQPNPAAVPGGMFSPNSIFPIPLRAHLQTPAVRSKKYPYLNACLAADSTLIHPDLRKKPRTDITASTFNNYRHTLAMAYPVTNMRLICKSFPWTIDIVSPQAPITVEAVWEAMYAALQEHIHDSEWGFACQDKKLRETIEKAAEKRGKVDGDKVLKRIDWLGEHTVFKGLERSEEFEKMRLFPGSNAVAETWVIRLASN
ncbi:hypothetical protein K435DRAFT_86444 [Dendrothele bispora CBS 962.96]|uniref:DUF6699 domain-containing protein n=1 Tax=Dendrothele bispora (strain CBS 962.96) TaxID=1314807 RepID=A0A4S8M4B0_DENBC|nr:hypothetical protein K435DRAFT_86444 [Dendrothele bispora CBS 962.96]